MCRRQGGRGCTRPQSGWSPAGPAPHPLEGTAETGSEPARCPPAPGPGAPRRRDHSDVSHLAARARALPPPHAAPANLSALPAHRRTPPIAELPVLSITVGPAHRRAPLPANRAPRPPPSQPSNPRTPHPPVAGRPGSGCCACAVTPPFPGQHGAGLSPRNPCVRAGVKSFGPDQEACPPILVPSGYLAPLALPQDLPVARLRGSRLC